MKNKIDHTVKSVLLEQENRRKRDEIHIHNTHVHDCWTLRVVFYRHLKKSVKVKLVLWDQPILLNETMRSSTFFLYASKMLSLTYILWPLLLLRRLNNLYQSYRSFLSHEQRTTTLVEIECWVLILIFMHNIFKPEFQKIYIGLAVALSLCIMLNI